MALLLVLLVPVAIWATATPGVAAPLQGKDVAGGGATVTTYDQKQQGEYNIQLHLKDIQILALVGDGELFDNDYDYEYEYSEITLKPPTVEPLWLPSSTTTPSPSTSTSSGQSTPSPASVTSTSTSTAPPTEASSTSPASTTALTIKEKPTIIAAPPNQQQQQQSIIPVGIKVHKHSVSILDDGEQGAAGGVPHPSGEIVLRRCAVGYTRDQNGRCRRIRRPVQMPYGVSHLANIVNQLRNNQPAATAAGKDRILPD